MSLYLFFVRRFRVRAMPAPASSRSWSSSMRGCEAASRATWYALAVIDGQMSEGGSEAEESIAMTRQPGQAPRLRLTLASTGWTGELAEWRRGRAGLIGMRRRTRRHRRA